MQFLMMWHPVANAASAAPPAPGLMAAIDELVADMAKSDALVMTGAMMPLSSGGRIELAQGQVTMTDGPFIETKELIGGYCILKMASREEAVALARHFVDIHAQYGYEGTSEVRQLLGPDDYDPAQMG